MRALGLKVENTADVLDLKVENILERRLPTVVAKKKLADSPLHARQMVVHKRVLIDGKAISAPSYIVPVSEENKITIKKKVRKPKPATEAQIPTTTQSSDNNSPSEETTEEKA